MALTKIDDRGLKTPIDLLDNEKIRLGTGNDSEFVHDGTNTKWVTTNGNIRLLDDAIEFWNRAGNEPIAKFDANGSCELYHDDSKKFETTADGAKVTGKLEADSSGSNYPITVSGSEAAKILLTGANNPYIQWQEGTTNKAYAYWDHSNNWFELKNEETGSKIHIGASTDLYHGADKKFETLSTGVYSHGKVKVGDGNSFVAGDGDDLKLYHDGTDNHLFADNGIIKIRNASRTQFFNEDGSTRWADISSGGIQITDDFKFVAGSGDDLQIFHQASNNVSYIQQTVAAQHTIIKNTSASATGSIYIEPRSGKTAAKFDGTTGQVSLNYDGYDRLKTIDEGIAIYGKEGGSSEIYFYADEGDDDADKYRIKVADGGPLQIGNKHSGSWDTNIECNPSGNVELNFDNVKKLATDTNGITVSGNAQADGHVFPYSDSQYSCGLATNKWTAVYADNANIQDINLSNLDAESPNEADGTRGSWTIQEGADDLFLINRVNGKKYKFNLTQII